MCHNCMHLLHGRCPPIVCNDSESSCEDLLDKDKSVSIYDKKVHLLAVELSEVSKNLCVPILIEILETRSNLEPIKTIRIFKT